ncbi:vanadium-dependent haloperoxidase [Candidatus Thiosymbion oneisti]|uniref:vanadium-dependent haloperoxidase n=1 Tax=Candidatus Thiosymbion oneisti TaxID=589554 RepID=UPI000A6A951E|nr:vanadium-dependent haloperoxidase [Candidatus Thiosymbion oneisti]
MPTNQTPYPEGEDRSKRASEIRAAADKIRAERPKVITKNNGEEDNYAPYYITNFTKGLPHDDHGVVKKGAFEKFRDAINKPEWHFDVSTGNEDAQGNTTYCSTIEDPCTGKKLPAPSFRTWESPLAGHVYDLQGPDAGDVGMAPAPRLDSCELAVEMAEVYAAALLRDVPFSTIEAGKDTLISPDPAGNTTAVATAQELIKLIAGMDWFKKEPEPSCCNKPTRQETNRRKARLEKDLDKPDENGKFTCKTFLRGSAPGAKESPFLSQFLLVGNKGHTCNEKGEDYIQQGYIEYGTQVIDQRVAVHKVGVDFMTDWCSWLDVQNGADVTEAVEFESKRECEPKQECGFKGRFITTPRDLATYVHYDALYQAYLNACLIMQGLKIPFDQGFPEGKGHPTRAAFATFGGPHILSLLTEVATRALKAVRRQKFNYHCRTRPEGIGGLLTAYENEEDGRFGKKGEAAIGKLYNSLPSDLLGYIRDHNQRQNGPSIKHARKVTCTKSSPFTMGKDQNGKDQNLLLPMAFPEGSPMHPSYGAGHATVAGACVTILKAFFEMYDDDGKECKFPCAYKPSDDGMSLEKVPDELTVQGELNKLAANISIGRNMAGVHYYSDYYDSLRMGERIAVGILQEQIITYGEKVSMTFETFDGEVVVLESQPGSLKPLFRYHSGLGSKSGIVPSSWWTKHVY